MNLFFSKWYYIADQEREDNNDPTEWSDSDQSKIDEYTSTIPLIQFKIRLKLMTN